MTKAFLHQQTFFRCVSNTNQASNTSSVFRMTLQSKYQNLKPSSSVCALCIHFFDMLGCNQSKFSDNSKRSSTLSSSFIQNLHEGFSRSIAWPDERISSRALGGMPCSFKFLAFWIIAPYCSKCYFWWNDTLNTRYSVLRAYLLPFQIFGILQT